MSSDNGGIIYYYYYSYFVSNFNDYRSSIEAHALIMSLTFLVFFPAGALTLYLVKSPRVVAFVHGPLQIFNLALVLIGMALGISNGNATIGVDWAHTIVGMIVVSSLIAFQPLLGFLQHRYYRKHSRQAFWGFLHRWVGRCMIILGMINGGLGFWLVGPGIPSQTPWSAIIAYSVIAGVMAVFYISVLALTEWKKRRKGNDLNTEVEAK